MNELDDEIAKLFAENEPIENDDAFAAAVRRRVARRRRRLRAARIALIAAVPAAATALAVFAPGALAYPTLALDRLLASPVVALLACGAMVWWNRSQET